MKVARLIYIFLCLICANVSAKIPQRPATAEADLKTAQKATEPSVKMAFAKKALSRAISQHNITIQIKSYDEIVRSYLELRKLDTAKIYAERAVALAGTEKLDALKGNSLMSLGSIEYNRENYNASIYKYQQAILSFMLSNNHMSVAACYLNIGMCNDQLSQYHLAISNYLKACKTFETLKNDVYLAYCYDAIALSFIALKDNLKAIEYNRKALTIHQKVSDQRSVARSLNNLGYAWNRYGQPDSAAYFLSRSIKLYQTAPDSDVLVLPLQNMGAALRAKGNYMVAERYVDRSINIAKKYQLREELARGYLDKGELFSRQQNYAAGLQAANTAEGIAVGLKLPEVLMNVYALKATLFTHTGQTIQALEYTNKKDIIKDSIFTAAKNTAITELDVKYQTEQKEKAIKDLNLTNGLQKKVVKQQTTLIMVLVSASVVMLVLFAVAYHNFRLKNKANQRIQTLMRDMHHRVKNNLMILSGLFAMQINEFEDEHTKNTLRENESRLTSMNLIHNKLYQDNTTTRIEIQEYLTKLLQHIQGSFGGDDITLRIVVDQIELEADKAVAIGLIVNELATNAFKYAFEDKPDGEIFLSLKKIGHSTLQLVLSDNGKGIADVHKEKGASFGLKLVNLMARQLHTSLIVKQANGTRYEMEITV